jgi:hypothetical protein
MGVLLVMGWSDLRQRCRSAGLHGRDKHRGYAGVTGAQGEPGMPGARGQGGVTGTGPVGYGGCCESGACGYELDLVEGHPVRLQPVRDSADRIEASGFGAERAKCNDASEQCSQRDGRVEVMVRPASQRMSDETTGRPDER